MTFREMVCNHDDAALESLSSKGLLRRARRDADSGIATLETIGDKNATAAVEAETVTILLKGPPASNCTCKATGICRHILVAMLLLRDQFEKEPISSAGMANSNTNKTASSVTTATESIASLSEAQLKKFAGADWDKAINFLASEPVCSVKNEGVNVSVNFVELDASLMFIAGNKPNQVIYKGPKTRKRLLATVAMLQIRRQQGVESVSVNNQVANQVISEAFLNQAMRTVEQAILATIPGRSALGPDLLLDLSVSTRCEALPRLSAELRGLSRMSLLAVDHHVDFEPVMFLQQASRAYALLEALRSMPDDIALSGSVRRDYVKQNEMILWPLGVSRWRSVAGAVGLSAYMLEPATGRWLTLNEGRSAGTEHTFDLDRAYLLSLWGQGTLSGSQGYEIRVAEPHIALDDSLSTKGQRASRSSTGLSMDKVIACKALHDHWDALRQDVAARMQSGLRRRQTPLPALIMPSQFGPIGFDEIDQTYNWEVIDATGQALILHLDATDAESAIRLWRKGKRISAMVVDCQLKHNSFYVKPVATLSQQKNLLSVHNIDFDPWPFESGLKKMMSNYREKFSKPLKLSRTELDPVRRTLADAADELVALIDTGSGDKLSATAKRLESCGLTSLAEQLQTLARSDLADRSTYMSSLLRASYMIGEIRQIEALA